MNKTLIAAAVAGIVLLASNAQAQTVPEGYQLQQVLMMSRHNLRAPLANNGSGFAPIFPDTCYHLTHYWPAAADIPVASDNP
ncbi:hypothetical protein ACQ7BQ_18930, partial [Escherichia coli]